MSKEIIFKDKIFLLTGALSNFTRIQAANLITERNGIFTDRWIKNIDYLIVGDKPGIKLVKTRSHNYSYIYPKICIIGETDFAAAVLINSPNFVPRKNIVVPNSKEKIIVVQDFQIGGRSFDFED